MLFTDPFFVFYFLPIALLALRTTTWLSGFGGVARLVVVALTLAFYAFDNFAWPVLFLIIALSTYALSLAIARCAAERKRSVLLAAGTTWLVVVLGLFKYLGWLSTLIPALQPLRDAIASAIGHDHDHAIPLPPGISFYTFEAISYLIDVRRRSATAPSDPTKFLCFIAMFPRFIAGPIVRYTQLAEQVSAWRGMRVADGLALFAIGFALKTLFADQAAVFVAYAFDTPAPDAAQAWIGAISYTIQIYYDFWGYSLMATGVGLCLGFSFPDNFRSPYHADSLGEFWRRWHMTLSSWIRDYVYFSLGGSRRGTTRTCLNLVLTMAIAGIWHGANFTFLVWGILQGVWMSIENLCRPGAARLPRWARVVVTMLVVVCGWVLFRSGDCAQALGVYRGLLGLNGLDGKINPLHLGNNAFAVALTLAAVAFTVFGERRLLAMGPAAEWRFPVLVRVAIAGAFPAVLAVSLSNQRIPFLYFQF